MNFHNWLPKETELFLCDQMCSRNYALNADIHTTTFTLVSSMTSHSTLCSTQPAYLQSLLNCHILTHSLSMYHPHRYSDLIQTWHVRWPLAHVEFQMDQSKMLVLWGVKFLFYHQESSLLIQHIVVKMSCAPQAVIKMLTINHYLCWRGSCVLLLCCKQSSTVGRKMGSQNI